jgi:hypothetical protein
LFFPAKTAYPTIKEGGGGFIWCIVCAIGANILATSAISTYVTNATRFSLTITISNICFTYRKL